MFGGLTYIFQAGKAAQVQEIEEAAPVLKGMLTDSLFAHGGSTLALHCAMLMRGGHALLLAGPPGAGKTTLTVNLLARGFEYAADDITLLMRDGRVRGVSFAPAIKSGAQALVKDLPLHLERTPVHKRLDGRRVRYASNLKLTRKTPVRVKWIANLQRSAAAKTEWKPAGLTGTLKELIKGAHTSDQRLNDMQVRVLIEMISTTTSGVLEYSNAASAARLLEKICETQQA
jgi:DNA polymerase III delta prime subunit